MLLTDTLYGIVGAALQPKAVERIYTLRKRNRTKPMIVLIASPKDLARFKVKLDHATKKILHTLWPGKVSVVLPCHGQRFAYLHRGTGAIAFRMPKNKMLISLIARTGPLVAPSANPAGLPPARTIAEAKRYFGDRVDFYVNGGRKKSRPSTVITIRKGVVTLLRAGATKIGGK